MNLLRIYYNRPNGNSYSAVIKESQIEDIINYSDIYITKIQRINGASIQRDYILK